jgi:hypothetical protein
VHPAENNWEIKSSSGGIPKWCWWRVRKEKGFKKKKNQNGVKDVLYSSTRVYFQSANSKNSSYGTVHKFCP